MAALGAPRPITALIVAIRTTLAALMAVTPAWKIGAHRPAPLRLGPPDRPWSVIAGALLGALVAAMSYTLCADSHRRKSAAKSILNS